VKAFAEHLCEHCFIVRSGAHAEKMYDDFEYAVVVVKRPDGTAEGKALVALSLPWWLKWLAAPWWRPLSRAHIASAFALAKTMGLKLYFERARNKV
jgi:hypothetical protein